LHHGGLRTSFRLADQQMDVFRHHHIPHHHETILLTNLFQNLQKQVAAARSCKPGLAMVTTASEKVEILVPVVTLQAVRHVLHSRAVMPLHRGKMQIKILSGSQLGIPTLCTKRKGWARPPATGAIGENRQFSSMICRA
jgi:hypothetical protein